MVIQRTIENLRERSKEERRAVAAISAGVVMVLLFVLWLIFFVRGIQDLAPVQLPSGESQNPPTQQ